MPAELRELVTPHIRKQVVARERRVRGEFVHDPEFRRRAERHGQGDGPVQLHHGRRRLLGERSEERLRFSSPLFRLGETDLINERVTFPGSGPEASPGLVVMGIDDLAGEYAVDIDPELEGLLVVFNTTPDPVTEQVDGFAGRELELSQVQADGADDVVRTTAWDVVSGTVTVPARTVAVLVEDQEKPLDPALALSPTTVRRGGQVTAALNGYAPGENIDLTLGTTSVATVTADDDGAMSATFTVPKKTKKGSYTVTALGLTSGAEATAALTVQNGPGPPPVCDRGHGSFGWFWGWIWSWTPHAPPGCTP